MYKGILLLDSLSGRKGNICAIMNADRKPVYGLKFDQKHNYFATRLRVVSLRYDIL
jgi:hypothetical protein